MKVPVEVIVIAHHGEGAFWPVEERQAFTLDTADSRAPRIVGDTAALLTQKALTGHLWPTARKDGGRG